MWPRRIGVFDPSRCRYLHPSCSPRLEDVASLHTLPEVCPADAPSPLLVTSDLRVAEARHCNKHHGLGTQLDFGHGGRLVEAISDTEGAKESNGGRNRHWLKLYACSRIIVLK
jgi:hypothetical protein